MINKVGLIFTDGDTNSRLPIHNAEISYIWWHGKYYQGLIYPMHKIYPCK